MFWMTFCQTESDMAIHNCLSNLVHGQRQTSVTKSITSLVEVIMGKNQEIFCDCTLKFVEHGKISKAIFFTAVLSFQRCFICFRRAYHRSGRWSSVGRTLRGRRVQPNLPGPSNWCLYGRHPSRFLSPSFSCCRSPSHLSSSSSPSCCHGPARDITFCFFPKYSNFITLYSLMVNCIKLRINKLNVQNYFYPNHVKLNSGRMLDITFFV